MVDEYMLTEAEVSFIKLLEALDKTALHASCSAVTVSEPLHHPTAAAAAAAAAALAAAPAGDPEHKSKRCAACQTKSCCEDLVPECAVAGITSTAQGDCSNRGHATAASSSSSSASSSEGPGAEHSATLIRASSSELVFRVKSDCSITCVPDQEDCCQHAAAQDQSQHQGQKSDVMPSSKPQARSHASSHSSAGNGASMPLQMHRSSNESESSMRQASSGAAEASSRAGALEDASGDDSDQEWQGAACNMLSGDLQAAPQDMNDPEADSVDTVTKACDEEQAAGISHMQMLIATAKEVQVRGFCGVCLPSSFAVFGRLA